MHQDFQTTLAIMRKQLKASRRASRFMSATLVDGGDEKTCKTPSENVRQYSELTEKQQKYFDSLVKKQQQAILSNWKSVIEQYLEYRKPFLVDAYQLNQNKYNQRCPKLYVLPLFMPAGKHTYLVKNMETLDYTMHTTICDFRTEDPPVLIKELSKKRVERVFNKENSVFKDWKEDTDLSLQLACECDIGNSKLGKVVKDPLQLTAIYDALYKKYSDLKLLFLQQACNSVYPFVTSIDFQQNFVAKFIPPQTNKEKSQYDVAFAASMKAVKGQQKIGLNRGEFIEILVRVAIYKYLDTRIVKTPVLAFEKFMDEDIMPKWELKPTWQDFRTRYLWTLDVNDVFFANIFGLRQLHERFQTIHKQYLEMQEANYLFTTEVGLVNEYIFKVCFGFCKMTIQDEQGNCAKHQKLEFVEFLECIGRVAAAYWEHNREHLQEVVLAKKIEFVLDQLLPIVGHQRKDHIVNEESDEYTDEDY